MHNIIAAVEIKYTDVLANSNLSGSSKKKKLICIHICNIYLYIYPYHLIGCKMEPHDICGSLHNDFLYNVTLAHVIKALIFSKNTIKNNY